MFTALHREFDLSLSDGASDDDMPLTLPTESSLSGSIRKVRPAQVLIHLQSPQVLLEVPVSKVQTVESSLLYCLHKHIGGFN